MARVGIDVSHALGVGVPDIRKIAARAGKDRRLADELWATGVHEARILATLVAEPQALDDRRMEAWVADLSSWDV
jgi:3-methyladenine DNA glycosylase AlkD